MEEAYKQIIDLIVVTDEMRQRILKKIENTPIEAEKKRRLRPVYRYCAAAACVVLVAVGGADFAAFSLGNRGGSAVRRAKRRVGCHSGIFA